MPNMPLGNHTPTHLWYADKPPYESGKPQLITVENFREIYYQKTGKRFEYCETMVVPESLIPSLKGTLTNTVNEKVVNEVQALINQPRTDDIYIAYVNDQVGFAAYARNKIEAYSPVAIYAGEIVPAAEKNLKSDYLAEIPIAKQFSIDAEKVRGIAGFFNHLPYQELEYDPKYDSPLKRINFLRLSATTHLTIEQLRPFYAADDKGAKNVDAFKSWFNNTKTTFVNQVERPYRHIRFNDDLQLSVDNNWKSYETKMRFNLQTWHLDSVEIKDRNIHIAQQNLSRNVVVINNIPLTIFYAQDDIAMDVPLGYDYMLGSWTIKQCMPLLFDISGRVLERAKYRNTRMPIHSTRSNASDFCLDKEYYANIDSFAPIQVAIFERPISFFAIRDRFVENNIIPASHGKLALESLNFAQQLKQLFAKYMQNPAASNVRVKVYRQYPDAADSKQDLLCVVCQFSEFLAWANIFVYLKQFRFDWKSIYVSQEILFKNVNPFSIGSENQAFLTAFTQHLISTPNFFVNKTDIQKPEGLFIQEKPGQYCCIPNPTAIPAATAATGSG